ncbi:MAG: DUF2232 domain-containing protein [Actinomycetota bacterium]|nr:DUF2232 domain-containing protein [Actinomycetota bacterium]
MTVQVVGARKTVGATVAVLGGALLAPLVPPVGVPLAAFGLAILAFGGRGVLAAVLSAVGIAGVTLMEPTSALFVAPVFAVILVSLPLLRSRSALVVGSAYVAVTSVAAVVSDAAWAFLSGTNLVEFTQETIDGTIAQATSLLQDAGLAGGDATAEVLEAWKELMLRLWPLNYFETGLIVGLIGVFAVTYGARIVGVETNRLPRLRDLDLSVHVLWALVFGLLLLAAESFLGDSGRLAGTVGLNLLLGVRWLFFAQGMGVAAAAMERMKVRRGGRLVGYLLMILADTLFYAMSFVGLFDFWMNVRKLKRKDGKVEASLEGPVS